MMARCGKGPPDNGPSPNKVPGFSISPQEEESYHAVDYFFAHNASGLCATAPFRLRLRARRKDRPTLWGWTTVT